MIAANRAKLLARVRSGWQSGDGQKRPDLICRSPIFARLGSPRIAPNNNGRHLDRSTHGPRWFSDQGVAGRRSGHRR